MQIVSNEYKEAMQIPLRNRGYIKVSIGVINQTADKNVEIVDTPLTYFSDNEGIFRGVTVDYPYATFEQDFAALDGSMYFLPEEDSGMEYYSNGAVTNSLLGSIRFEFQGITDLDIKGLTIDFGECYPTSLKIENDTESYTYTLDSRYFATDDIFDGTSYIVLTPLEMLNGQNRLRIYSFVCGIANVFTNDEVLSFSSREDVSSIAEDLSALEMTVEVENYDQYYSPDNAASALNYMEIGQKMSVQFGYDVTGNGDIEWVEPSVCYMKTWSSTETTATFKAVDLFDYKLSGEYYKGQYYKNGISLYDLALLVLEDANVEEDLYYIDPYLKMITVHNPLPDTTHGGCLQIIANAGRCSLYMDRQGRIHLKSNFEPEKVASCNGETAYSNVVNILDGTEKDAYAEFCQDFSIVDGSLYFLPTNDNYYSTTGYVSEVVSDANGDFTSNPKVTITLEAGYVYHGLQIEFRNTTPQEFTITQYYDGSEVATSTYTNPDVDWYTLESSQLFDTLVIEVTKGYPNSRVYIDNVIFGAPTDYTLSRTLNINGNPTATRDNRVQAISVNRYAYSNSTVDIKSLSSATLEVADGDRTIVKFGEPCYGYQAEIIAETDANGNEIPNSYTVSIVSSGAYYVELEFGGIGDTAVELQYQINGYTYVVADNISSKTYHESGETVEWSNPLIDNPEMANSLIEWLETYYNGLVDYNIPWRGDPRVDANDLFYLEVKTGDTVMVQSYRNELNFSGAWSGTIKAKRLSGSETARVGYAIVGRSMVG